MTPAPGTRQLVFAVFTVVFLSSAAIAADPEFEDSGQALGSGESYGVALGDLDGDGDLDAFVANSLEGNRLWLNNGLGIFTDSGQSLGASASHGVALGDLDGDNDLDAVVANSGTPETVWLNDGMGVFFDSGQSLGSYNSQDVRIARLDTDADLDVIVSHEDVFVTDREYVASVWLNDGLANLSGGPALEGDGLPPSLDIGDLDGDDDVDSILCFPHTGGPGLVHLNSGDGSFTQLGQIPTSECSGVSLGDMDGDEDLDAFIARADISTAAPSWLFLNNGSAAFTDSGQSLGSSNTNQIALGDFDFDGDLDAFFATWSADTVWLNDGLGVFSSTGQALGSTESHGVALGDLDGDGDLDAFVVASGPNAVWLNQILVFRDDFESGDTTAWADTVP